MFAQLLLSGAPRGPRPCYFIGVNVRFCSRFDSIIVFVPARPSENCNVKVNVPFNKVVVDL